MSGSQILIVDGSPKRVQKLRDALSGALLPQPAHQPDGESAVQWAGVHSCDLCILSYELPGMDGLEAMARIRARQPSLPIIMIGETEERNVPIAAFRAGVIDYFPAIGAFAEAVADRAREQLEPGHDASEALSQAATDPDLSHILKQRLEPTYQNRLRTIGREIDMYQYHSVCLVEVKGGFVIRAMKQRGRRPEALEFSDRDLSRLVISSIQSGSGNEEKPIYAGDLTPTGYEDMLRALGYRLDQISAEAVVVLEMDDRIVVSGRGNDELSAVPGLVPFKMFLAKPDIDYMLNEAFHRRGTQQPQIKQPERGSGGLRRILRRLN